MCLGCLRWCHEKKSNPLRSIEKVVIGWSATWILRLQALRQNSFWGKGCRAHVRSWGWEPFVCRKSTERSWDSTGNNVLACDPAISAFPCPRHSKGKNSTTWCTLVFVAAKGHSRHAWEHAIVFLCGDLVETIDQLETTVWDSGPVGAQRILLDILDSIQIGNQGLLAPSNLLRGLAVDWLDSDMLQGSNFLQMSISKGAIAVNVLELHDSFCCCSWGWVRRGYLWVFCQCETAPSDPLCRDANQYLDALHFMYFQNSTLRRQTSD